MEMLHPNHLVCMKAIACIFLLFLSVHSMGQSQQLMNQISLDINRELEGVILRDTRYHFHFWKNEEDTIDYYGFGPPSLALKNIINRYADSIPLGERLIVSVYHDAYSPKVYAYTELIIPSGVFGNYSDLPSYPEGGMLSLLETIYSELRTRRNEIDTLSKTYFGDPIHIFIDSLASHRIIKGNKLINYLDSSFRIPWNRAIHNGAVIDVIAEIRLDRFFLKEDNREALRRYHKDVQISYVLPKQFGNKWVRFDEREPEYSGDIMVSFVFNPLTSKVENPVIIKGDLDAAIPLIDWIKELSLPTKFFHWPGIPYASRIYFFIDAES